MRVEDKSSSPPMEFSAGGFVTAVGRSRPATSTKSHVPSKSPIAGMSKPALEGWAVRYNKPHEYKGVIDVFAAGCFDATLAAGDKVGFWLSHDEDFEVASTNDRLELRSDERGLAFRLALHDDGIAELVAERKADAISPAYRIIESQMRELDGVPFRLIKKAALREVSLVRRGVIPQTFARIIDTAKCGPLSVEMKGPKFEVESAFTVLMRKLQDASDAQG